jgi:hypothetical protein
MRSLYHVTCTHPALVRRDDVRRDDVHDAVLQRLDRPVLVREQHAQELDVAVGALFLRQSPPDRTQRFG